jgi:4-hydroxy-tetrahydrodipicolinate synthase
MISGSMVALVTPMDENGAIDWACLGNLVDWHISEGTDAIVATGTTGESATLSMDEHCKVVRYIIDCVAGRVPVIAGTGGNSTQEAIILTQEAKDAGADACLLVTPYYNKPTQEGLYLHFKKISETVDIKQILYNVPGRTITDLLPETVARLSHLPNIIGIKEATGDISRGVTIKSECGEDFILLSGDDATFLQLMQVGAVGNISVTANVAPKLMAQICGLANAGDMDQAAKLNEQLMPLHSNLFVEANPIPVKYALQKMGKIPAGIRLPLTPLSAQYHSLVDKALHDSAVLL